MTRHTRHITTALLALCLLLTACGGKQTGGSPGRLSGTAAYTSDIAPLDLPLTELTASAAGSGDLYLAGLEEAAPDEAEDGDGEITSSGSFSFSSTATDDGGFTFSTGMGTAALYRLDADTGELMKLSGYAPEEGVSVAAIVPCEDGSLWVLERVSGGMEGMTLDDLGSGLMAAGGGISWASQVWRKLDAAGEQELDRIDVTNLAEKLGVEAVTDTRMDPSGQLYAASGSTVTVLDASLSTLFTCRGQETVERLVSLSGGVGAVAGDENGRTVYPVDLESQGLGPARPLSGSADRIYDGNEKYDFFYSSGDSLYGWSAENAAPEKVLSWSGAGVDKGQVETLALLPDGRGTAALREGSWPASYSRARLAPAGEEELAGRRCCLSLCRRMHNAHIVRLLRRIANDKQCAARDMCTAYYLITGQCYTPAISVEQMQWDSLAAALRSCYHQEACNGFNYARAADGTADLCLQKLFTKLSQQAYKRADEVMCALGQVLC